MEPSSLTLTISREQALLKAVAVVLVNKHLDNLRLLVKAPSKSTHELVKKMIADAEVQLKSLNNGTLHIESIKEISSELARIDSTHPASEEMSHLKDKVKALEEYCLNVDYIKFPPPQAVQYLFVKTTGTVDYYENSPPVNGKSN